MENNRVVSNHYFIFYLRLVILRIMLSVKNDDSQKNYYCLTRFEFNLPTVTQLHW